MQSAEGLFLKKRGRFVLKHSRTMLETIGKKRGKSCAFTADVTGFNEPFFRPFLIRAKNIRIIFEDARFLYIEFMRSYTRSRW